MNIYFSLRCTTLNSKIYMTTMNNESYCCVLISLPWKKVWWSTIKNYWQKNKIQWHTVLVHSSDGELWCFLCLGITADPMMDPRILIHKLFSKLWMLILELPKTDGQGYSYIFNTHKFWTKVIKNWWIQYGNFTSNFVHLSFNEFIYIKKRQMRFRNLGVLP